MGISLFEIHPSIHPYFRTTVGTTRPDCTNMKNESDTQSIGRTCQAAQTRTASLTHSQLAMHSERQKAV